jgi:hypothetical protein
MFTDHLTASHHSFITAQVEQFRATGNLLILVKALTLVVRQHRTRELILRAYCSLVHSPSAVRGGNQDSAVAWMLRDTSAMAPQGTLTRQRIVERYGRRFSVASLPRDFHSARAESVCDNGDHLIIGEYGESPRIACVTRSACLVSEHYCQVAGVRHIHSIQRYGDSGDFLVSTGDSKKFLDLWVAGGSQPMFVRRLRKHMAGFTAAIRVNGEYYFGTDFSGRPNWIETMGGSRYFFPQKAYRLQVTDFHAFLDRYLLVFNTELLVVGGRKTLSIFDTLSRHFIYCENWPLEELQAFRHAV